MKRMPTLIVTLASLAAVALAAPKHAAKTGCHGKITGALTAEFGCVAEVATTDAGKPVFTITPRDPVADAPVYKPGSFELPAAPVARAYTLDDLGMGMASLAVEGGALYTATKTSSQRGEVALTLRSVKPVAGRPGAWTVHGTYHARLLPAGGGKTGEVVLDVSF